MSLYDRVWGKLAQLTHRVQVVQSIRGVGCGGVQGAGAECSSNLYLIKEKDGPSRAHDYLHDIIRGDSQLRPGCLPGQLPLSNN